MDGLARAAGSGVPFVFRGRTVIVQPLTFEDLGTVEQHMLATRPNVLKQAAEAVRDLPDDMDPALREDLKNTILDKAVGAAKTANTIPVEDVMAWMWTVEGLVFVVWLQLKKDDPSLTLEDVRHDVQMMSTEQQRQLRDVSQQASGTDQLGNSTGQTRGKPRKGRRGRKGR